MKKSVCLSQDSNLGSLIYLYGLIQPIRGRNRVKIPYFWKIDLILEFSPSVSRTLTLFVLRCLLEVLFWLILVTEKLLPKKTQEILFTESTLS